MENSILEKEDKYIKDGYKQIYPNDKDIKVTLLNRETAWQWIRKAFDTGRLTIGECFKNKDDKFLRVEEYYQEDSFLQLQLIKNSQKLTYSVCKFYLATKDSEHFLLTQSVASDYNEIAKKIDKIYFDISEGRLLILLDEKFISKAEEKIIAKKEKVNKAKKSIYELFE